MSREPDAVFHIGNAVVRIHGKPDRAKVEDATIKYIKRVAILKKKRKEER